MKKRLSIFVDESGDFGFKGDASSLYIVSLVFHDQSQPLEVPLQYLNNRLIELGLSLDHCVHTAPLIRNDNEYSWATTKQRQSILFAMRQFLRHSPTTNKTFVFQKSHFNNEDKLAARIARDLGAFLKENLRYFQEYESRVLYYDNGQSELGRILNTSLNAHLDVEIKREVKPGNYRLFQLTDFICTLELMFIKEQNHALSKKEAEFFSSNKLLKQLEEEIRRKSFEP